MNAIQLVVIALCSGIIGVLITCAVYHIHARFHNADEVIPDEIMTVIGLLDSTAIVCDGADRAVVADEEAYKWGLLKGSNIINAELLDLIRQVREKHTIITHDMSIQKSPLSVDDMTLVKIRLALLKYNYVIILIDDISTQKRLEKMRRDFVVNVSHELKTPIGAIVLLAETLSSHAHNAQAVEKFSQQLMKESQRLTQLVADIIHLARVQDATALTSCTRRVKIDDVISSAADYEMITAQKASVDLILPEYRSNVEVWADQDLLITAVRNLIDNAIRYSPAHSQVKIGVKCVDDVVHIAVVDQGCGIPAEDQERIFERFYRVDADRSRSLGGTGLGLSIVKHIMTNHGGTVRVWSKIGQGSTFTLMLPLAHDSEK